MKRLTAILLLLLLLFNTLGYQLMFYYVQQRSDAHFVTRLDEATYQEEDLITLTLPLNMPYQVDRPDFERVDGEINIGGKVYKYVKRKVQEGQLVLLCLPDHNKMRLQEARQDYFKQVNDLPNTSSPGKTDHAKSKVLKGLLGEYLRTAVYYFTTPIPEKVIYNIPAQAFLLNSFWLQTPEQPPDFMA